MILTFLLLERFLGAFQGYYQLECCFSLKVVKCFLHCTVNSLGSTFSVVFASNASVLLFLLLLFFHSCYQEVTL